MKTYFLPEKNRAKLQQAFGEPLYGGTLAVANQYSKFIKGKKYHRIITIGDYCSTHIDSDVKIFDRKVQRKAFTHQHQCAQTIKNAPGTIQKKAWPAVKFAIKNKVNLCVDGEEDLLVIPAVLQSRSKNLVIYGLPNQGICLIETSPQIKKEFRAFLAINFTSVE